MRKYSILVIAAIITGVVAAAVIANSGDGDKSNNSERTDLPTLQGSGTGTTTTPTVKSKTTKTDTNGTDDTGGSTVPDTSGSEDSGGSDQGSQGGGGAEAPTQDSPENDTPPPANSAPDRFEKFCRDNPGAC